MALPRGGGAQLAGQFLTRLELQALIETFNAELLSHASATATLEKWCADHGLAREAKVTAILERGREKVLDEDGRQLLAVHRVSRWATAMCGSFAGISFCPRRTIGMCRVGWRRR